MSWKIAREDHLDVTEARLERTRRLMDQVNTKCLVSGHQARIPAFRFLSTSPSKKEEKRA